MYCPHCGAELKEGAKFCPHCGSDETTGWADGAEFSNEELPDYNEIVENEFGVDANGKKVRKQNPLCAIAAVIIIVFFVLGFVLH